MSDILIILFLILLNGVLSMCEIAIVNARKSLLTAEAKKGDHKSERVLKLMEHPERFLSTIQIWITLIGILTGLFSGAAFSRSFAGVFISCGMGSDTALNLARGIIVVVVTLVSIVLGELLPKKIGLSASEKISKKMSGIMVVLAAVCSPLVWVLEKTTKLLARTLNVKEQEAKVTEEEIKSMVAEGAEDGEVQDVEQDIVERVFSLGDRTVDSIMTNRADIVWIDAGMANGDINAAVKENLHEVYPVGEGSLDKIIGVVYLKDLFGKLDNPGFSINDILQTPNWFHENMDVYKVLENLKESQTGYGIVCDEYGVCKGIVTLKDILEGLVGQIETQEDEPDIVKRDNGTWLIDGQCPFYEFLAYFDMEELEDESEEDDYNTIGGLVLNELEHIPKTGESIDWHDFHIEVVDMDGARIDKVLVSRKVQGIS